jgi:hypothetical protein
MTGEWDPAIRFARGDKQSLVGALQQATVVSMR